MSSNFITAAAGVGVASALAVGVCVAATGASAASDRPLTTFTVSKGHSVSGPSHLAPGYVGIHLKGPQSTLFQIVESRHGAGKGTLIKEGAAANRGDVKGLEDDFKAIGGSAAHGNNLFVKMDAGTYYALDVDAKKLTKSMIQKITVAGTRSNSAKPAIAATITSVGDMKWGKTPNRIPASGYLQFRNRSTKNANNTHFIALVQLKKGKKYGDVKKVFEGKEDPSKVFASGPHTQLGTGILSFSRTQISTYSLKPGRYMLACFFSDRANGQPHAYMGMYRTIVVG